MKRTTAIRHLGELAAEASHRVGIIGIDFPVKELWVAGELLEAPAEVDHVDVIVSLDLPARELPWLSLDPRAQYVASVLRLPQRPVLWFARSSEEPAWNPVHRSAARFWDAETGEEARVSEKLRAGEPVGAEVAMDDYAEQMAVELARSRAHLSQVLDVYWDPGWRRAHKGSGVYPEDHLWRAAQAVQEIEEALASL